MKHQLMAPPFITRRFPVRSLLAGFNDFLSPGDEPSDTRPNLFNTRSTIMFPPILGTYHKCFSLFSRALGPPFESVSGLYHASAA